MNNGCLISRGLKQPREELIILKQHEKKTENVFPSETFALL